MPCTEATYGGDTRNDVQWENCVGTVQQFVPIIYEPTSLEDIVWILQQAEKEGHRVKAVGSGWSFENLAASRDWMVDIGKLVNRLDYLVEEDAGLAALTEYWEPKQRSDSDDRLFHVEAGISLAELNVELETAGFAMRTLPGAKGMTLAGAISTGTHGSDIDEPPLADLVQAIHLVTTSGQEVWIESNSNPVTLDDDALLTVLPCSEDTLIIRDDDALNAVRVSLGRFGIIYSYVLRVRKMFRLAEWAEQLSWETVSNALASGVGRDPNENSFEALEALLTDPPADLGITDTQDYVYLDITFNPRRASNCWVRRRWITEDRDDLANDSDPGFICHHLAGKLILEAAILALTNYAALVSPIPIYGLIKAAEIMVRVGELAAYASHVHIAGGRALAMAVNAVWASQIGDELRWLLEELNELGISGGLSDSTGDGKRGPGWQIISGPPEDGNPRLNCNKQCSRGNAVEFVFGLETRAYIDFVNQVLIEAPRYPVSGYVSLRFTKVSQALLSMHNVRHHMAASIEVISLRGLSGNEAFMRLIDAQARSLGGRPHWGQQNDLRSWEVVDLYGIEALSRWRNQLLRFAGLSSTFSNDFTVQRGLEPVQITRQVTSISKKSGIISQLRNDKEFWSPVSVADAILEITLGIAEYFIILKDESGEIPQARRYVVTAADESLENNLTFLPDANADYDSPPVNLVSLQVTSVIRTIDSLIIEFLCNDNDEWCIAVDDAYIQINANTHEYYVIDETGNRANLETREASPSGSLATSILVRRYVTTAADSRSTNNLDSLPIVPNAHNPPPISLTSLQVTSVIRAIDMGIIEFLCNDDDGWSVAVTDAYVQINASTHEYYVIDDAGNRANLETREYLTTSPDMTRDNNLLSLPSL